MRRALLAILLCAPLFAASSYPQEIAQWRSQREAALKAPDGWLTVSGLFWLREGDNRFGRDEANQIVLPDGPARTGVFHLHSGKVTVDIEGATRPLQPDSDVAADMVKVGRLTLTVIKRGDRFGIRMRDPDSKMRRDFHGIASYPTNEQYRVTARFVPSPSKIAITNLLGQTTPEDSPGYVVFRLNGKELRLYPVVDDPASKSLFFVFRDLTTGKTTYGAGRFLEAEAPHNGQVTLDFNEAYNPPCAFTPYATCPLPPKENRLPVAIEAGEKKYGH
ncbi:MAG TPA: DUF1684 domain-containing protein [Bryobacteraceae bacterium]|nr:DUF1684 domain-containing protein [Bryobacteraceae bacterium]